MSLPTLMLASAVLIGINLVGWSTVRDLIRSDLGVYWGVSKADRLCAVGIAAITVLIDGSFVLSILEGSP